MAEPRPIAARVLRLEYRFDRLSADKLAQAYQLLVPDRRRAIAETSAESFRPHSEINDEQTRGDLCSSVFRSAEREPHDCEPDGGSDRARRSERLYRAGGMGLPR